MFPSAGYFRSAICPFYAHGLCHRPYCHFKHVKPVKEEPVTNTANAHTYSNANRSPERENVIITQKTVVKNEKPDVGEEISEVKENTDSFSRKFEGSTEVKPILMDITSLLKIPGGHSSDNEVNDASLQTKELHIEDKKKQVKKGKAQSSGSTEKKKKGLQLTDLDFFSPKISKTNAKKNAKLESGKGVKRKVPETDQEVSTSKKNSERPQSKEEKIKTPEMKGSTDISKREIDQKIDIEASEQKIKSQKKEESGNLEKTAKPNFKRTASGMVDYIPETCIETVGHGSVKKRIAHTDENEYTQKQAITTKPHKIFPKKPSYVSPILSGHVGTASGGVISEPQGLSEDKIPEVQKSEEKNPAYSSEEGFYLGKKRTAHPLNFYKKEQAKSSLKRPKIPIEFGAKVPQNIRQRYLDKLIDEYLPKTVEEQEAFDKAVEEEAGVYQRSTRRQIYVNLCVNAIKKIRELPEPQDNAFRNEEGNNPLVTGETTTKSLPLPSGLSRQSKSKVYIRPPTIPLAGTNKKHSSLLDAKQGNVVVRRASKEPTLLTEDAFYDHLLRYLASSDDLWDNNYPRPISGQPDGAVFKQKPKEPSETETKRICIRCGKQFFMDEDGEYITQDECHYHWGKIRRMRGRGDFMNFSCCHGEAGSSGCCACKRHVSDFSRTPSGFVNTDDSTITSEEKKVYALDCEMCYTARGLELTRISVVNFHLQEVYDSFVKPDRPVIDYNTRFSGVTESSLKNVNVKLKDVQKHLFTMFHKNTILLGHSLESDLKALKMIHNKVVDTALVFPHKMGLPYKRALRNLMADHLKKIIQESEGGHDSSEDSSACMELMRWKVMEDIRKSTRTKHY